MSNWTKEPWPDVAHGSMSDGPDRPVLLRPENYDRARACVNSLAGRDPSKLAELVRAADLMACCPGIGPARALVHQRELSDALAAFRMEK